MTDNTMRVLHTCGSWNGKTVEIVALTDARDHFVQVQLEGESKQSHVGEICIGCVQKIVPDINAAFVELGNDRIAYLSLEDATQILYTKKINSNPALCQGDEIVVEIIKDPIKTKKAVCTCNLSFRQKDVMLTSGRRGCGVSRKMEQGRREEIKRCFADVALNEYGLVFRTSAETCSMEELAEQADLLKREYEAFCDRAQHRTVGTLLRERESLLLSFLQQLPQGELERISEVVSDDPDVLEQIPQIFNGRLYTDRDYSLWKLYGMERQLKNALQTHVRMKSGAYLVIEPTEALTVIDVNSGKKVTGKSAEEAVMDINREACAYIAHQLRLRNISGMILVDFINVKSEENRKELLSYLRNLVSRDAIPVQVLDFTKLGLVEMTRKKICASLQQQLELL